MACMHQHTISVLPAPEVRLDSVLADFKAQPVVAAKLQMQFPTWQIFYEHVTSEPTCDIPQWLR